MSEITFPTAVDQDVRLTLDLDTNTTTVSLKSGEAILATYENNAWTPVGSGVKIGGGSDITIEEYIKKEGSALTKQSTAQIGLLSKEDQKKWSSESSSFPPFKNKNQASSNLLKDIGGALTQIQKQNVSYPTDNTYFTGRYPINQQDQADFDHFRITCYDHQPSGLKANAFILPDIDDRKKVSKGVVTLPMQPGIQEGNTVNWGSENINPLHIAALGVADPLMDLDFKTAMDNLVKAGTTLGNDLTPDVIKSWFAGKAIGANILGRATGQTINNNVEVLFNGPGLRTFNYNYRFTPREPKEAVMIKNIIRFFKKQMAPKRSTSRIFLKSPNVFKLKYVFKNGDHPFLNNIKMCALNGFTVDYTPDGSYSTYNDDGGEGDGSMTSYNVGLSFMEMTPIYNEDFFRDSEGKEGTGF